MDAVSLALLNRSIHDLEQLRIGALNGAATRSQRNEGRGLAGQDGVGSAVNPEHEVLNSCRAQTDQTRVMFTCLRTTRANFRQIKSEAVVADLVVLSAHLL